MQNFIDAVIRDAPLVASARGNLGTVAVVEAARLAVSEHRQIDPRTLLAESPRREL